MEGAARNNADITSHVGGPGASCGITNLDNVAESGVTEKPSASSGSDVF